MGGAKGGYIGVDVTHQFRVQLIIFLGMAPFRGLHLQHELQQRGVPQGVADAARFGAALDELDHFLLAETQLVVTATGPRGLVVHAGHTESIPVRFVVPTGIFDVDRLKEVEKTVRIGRGEKSCRAGRIWRGNERRSCIWSCRWTLGWVLGRDVGRYGGVSFRGVGTGEKTGMHCWSL